MNKSKRTSAAFILICVILFLAASIPTDSYAEPLQSSPWDSGLQSEELQNILQQSLSIQELDDEISRISARADEAAKKRTKLEAELAVQQEQLQEKQEMTGRALRSYYMGEKDLILKAALSADSLSDMFRLMDYYIFLFENDKRTLDDYRDNVRSISKLQKEQQQLENELTQVKQQLLDQRERMIKLEQDLDNSVMNSSDPEAMRQLILEFNAYWQSVGLFEVKHYFNAIAKAMQSLPDFIAKNGNLVANGLNYTLTIKDEELNQFLQAQDPMFKDFAFVFKQDSIAAVGKREGIQVYVEGRYTLEFEPEHAIRFHIDKLQFNGLTLSEATRNEMAEQFDLSFYPQQLVKFIEATEVKLEPGLLTVQLQVKL
ncbi:hypothetical protein [Paenibacillus marinisediminis]